LEVFLYLLRAVSPVAKYRRALGEAIRFRRKQAGLSQEKLAEKAELHPVYISAVERGVKTISMDALMRIAKALNVRVRDLVENI
jgi:transcriptional regulator with XRE-family HTH domain